VGQDFSELKNLMEWETWNQEMPQWSSKDTIGGLPDFRIFCLTAEVSGFVKYQLLY
jgi:hypothetical protein